MTAVTKPLELVEDRHPVNTLSEFGGQFGLGRVGRRVPTDLPKGSTVTPSVQTIAIAESGTCATESPDYSDAAFTITQRGKPGAAR